MNSKVYRKAAQIIFNWGSYDNDNSYQKYCCNAIEDADIDCNGWNSDFPPDYQLPFEQYFKPQKLPKGHYSNGWWGPASPKTDEQRILALLFMELIAEDLNSEKAKS
jgi:hypothetical protein